MLRTSTKGTARHDTQVSTAEGIPRGVTYKTRQGVQIPSFRQYAPEAFLTLKKSYVKYIIHVSELESGKEPVKKTTKFSDNDIVYAASSFPTVLHPSKI